MDEGMYILATLTSLRREPPSRALVGDGSHYGWATGLRENLPCFFFFPSLHLGVGGVGNLALPAGLGDLAGVGVGGGAFSLPRAQVPAPPPQSVRARPMEGKKRLLAPRAQRRPPRASPQPMPPPPPPPPPPPVPPPPPAARPPRPRRPPPTPPRPRRPRVDSESGFRKEGERRWRGRRRGGAAASSSDVIERKRLVGGG